MSKKKTQTDIGDDISEARKRFVTIKNLVVSEEKKFSYVDKLKYLNELDTNYYGKMLASLANVSTKDGYKKLIKLFNGIAELNVEMGHVKRAIKDEFEKNYKKHLVDGEEEEESDNEGEQYQYLDLEISRQTDYMQCYTDAAVCYRHILSILRDRLKVPLESFREDDELIKEFGIEYPYQKLNEVQDLILKFATLDSSTSNLSKVTKINSFEDVDKVAGKKILKDLRKYVNTQIEKTEVPSKKQDIKCREIYFCFFCLSYSPLISKN
jgi:lipoate-protein ligase A